MGIFFQTLQCADSTFLKSSFTASLVAFLDLFFIYLFTISYVLMYKYVYMITYEYEYEVFHPPYASQRKGQTPVPSHRHTQPKKIKTYLSNHNISG